MQPVWRAVQAARMREAGRAMPGRPSTRGAGGAPRIVSQPGDPSDHEARRDGNRRSVMAWDCVGGGPPPPAVAGKGLAPRGRAVRRLASLPPGLTPRERGAQSVETPGCAAAVPSARVHGPGPIHFRPVRSPACRSSPKPAPTARVPSGPRQGCPPPVIAAGRGGQAGPWIRRCPPQEPRGCAPPRAISRVGLAASRAAVSAP